MSAFRWVVVAGLVLLAAGCGTPDHVRLAVTPRTALYDAPVTATARGLHAHEKVTATLSLPDHYLHSSWVGHAAETADGHGRLRFRLDRLIGSMRPLDHRRAGFFPAGYRTFPMTLTLTDGGHRLATTSARRETPQSAGLVTETQLRPASGGLYADVYEPTHATGATSAVAVWGGSEGGITAAANQAALLAAHGHPALALAYFDEPGIPTKLLRIPIEYFAAAVRRLDAAPNVDPSRVYVWGTSRGSEAAALTALHYPDLVHGVIDGVPSSTANAALGVATPQAAWTVGGKDVPVGVPVGDPESSDVPAAKFHLQDFPGPVLAVCGRSDRLWPSCPFARALAAEDPTRVRLLSYRGAGHLVGTLVPYLPSSVRQARGADGDTEVFGGTPAADAAGEADAWPRVLAFLGR